MFKLTIRWIQMGFLGFALLGGATYGSDYFAAIAFSHSTARMGSANNAKSLAEAKVTALRNCSYSDCFIAAEVKNGCVAAAISYGDINEKYPKLWYGFGRDGVKSGAEALALEICEYDSKQYCSVIESLCTRTEPEAEVPATFAEVTVLAPENGPEALGILKLVNIASGLYLRDTVGISERTATLFGDHGYFATIAEIVTDTKISLKEFRRLLGFARTTGYIKAPVKNPGTASTDSWGVTPHPAIEFYKAIVLLALPTEEETELREKCRFDSWANVGTMSCECNLDLKVGCKTNDDLNRSSIRGLGISRKPLFTSVCKNANRQAKLSLDAAALSYETACLNRGGIPFRLGGIQYAK